MFVIRFVEESPADTERFHELYRANRAAGVCFLCSMAFALAEIEAEGGGRFSHGRPANCRNGRQRTPNGVALTCAEVGRAAYLARNHCQEKSAA